MRVGLAGLISLDNCGEQFIVNTVEYLVKKILPDAEIIYIDMNNQKPLVRKCLAGSILVTSKLLKGRFPQLDYFAYKIWEYPYFKKKIREVDLLIFAAGSFKYGTQNLWAKYSLLVELAQNNNIPVMFNAMNIQKYDESSWKCQCLKGHANYECVKMITTRDGYPGIERLKQCYLTNKSIKLDCVGDPAFWLGECYGISRQCRDTIGINLISESIFLRYGINVTPSEVVAFYADAIRYFLERNIKIEFFTNRLSVDLKPLNQILKRAGVSEMKYQVSVPKNDRELARMIAGYRGVFGARLHTCICAYALDVPLIGFIWDEKMQRFSEIAKIKDRFFDASHLNGYHMAATLLSIMDQPYDVENREYWKKQTLSTIRDFLGEQKKDEENCYI